MTITWPGLVKSKLASSRNRWIVASGVGIVAVGFAGGIVLGSSSNGARAQTLVPSRVQAIMGKSVASKPSPKRHHMPVPAMLGVVRATPVDRTLHANGLGAIVIHFDARIIKPTRLPTLSPRIAGRWYVTGDSFIFRPRVAILPNTLVVVHVPAGVRGAGDRILKRPYVWEFGTRSGSIARAEQILAELGYLPLRFVPTRPVAQNRIKEARSLWAAPTGKWVWKFTPPPSLAAQWSPGTDNEMLSGALVAFESNRGLPVDGTLGSADWAALLSASLNPGGWKDPHGYTYAIAQEGSPESLTVFDNGRVVLSTPANTGISVDPTSLGTYYVYEKLPSQVMQGTNPDGSHYSDPVQYVSYFNGGDAVHYMYRASYGYPQSLGCVELPLSAAATAYPYLTLGTLVTVDP